MPGLTNHSRGKPPQWAQEYIYDSSLLRPLRSFPLNSGASYQMRVLFALAAIAFTILCTSCVNHSAWRNEHGILEYRPVASAPEGVEIKLIQSPNAPAQFQLSIRPKGDGSAHWSSRELQLRISQWHSASVEQCKGKAITVIHGPDNTTFVPEYCSPDHGESDCGVASISGDFSCEGS